MKKTLSNLLRVPDLCRSLALAILACSSSLPVCAQETILTQPTPATAAPTTVAPVTHTTSCNGWSNAVDCLDPELLNKGAWDVYLRAGIACPVGNGDIDDHVRNGWTIQLGFREPVSCCRPNLTLYADFGLGFTRNNGDQQPVLTSGFFQALIPPDDHIHEFNDFAQTQLVNLQRPHIYAALDADYHPGWLNNGSSRWAALTGRAGARYTRVRAEYIQSPTATLIEAYNEHIGHGHAPAGFLFHSFTEDKDDAFGLFVGVGAQVTFFNSYLFGSDVTLGADVEYGYDWFNLGSYSRKDDGLATITPMGRLALSF